MVTASVRRTAAWEEPSLIAYADPVSLLTICEDYVHGIKLSDVTTPVQCDVLTEQEARKVLEVVDGLTPRYRNPTYP